MPAANHRPGYALPPISANEPFVLYEGPVTLQHRGRTVQCQGIARLRWFPSPGIRLTLEAGWATFVEMKADTLRVRLGNMKETTVQITSISLGAQSKVEAFVSSAECKSPKCLSAIRFWIVNFPDFITPSLLSFPGEPSAVAAVGTVKVPSEAAWTRQAAQLQNSEWRVNIVATRDSRQTYGSLNANGGYAITHIGEVVRRNGRPFLVKRAKSLLSRVDQFLSFARGAACASPVRWGLAADGAVVWQQFGSPIVDQWKQSMLTWFDNNHGQFLAEVFEEFTQLHDHPTLSEPFRLALYWYRKCATGSGGPEGSIVLGMTALELLSALIVVDRKTAMSTGAHDKLSAKDKLRELLRAIHVPFFIPARYQALSSFARQRGWTDACETLAEFRHGYVHPKKTRRQVVLQANGRVLLQVKWLTLWYQELAFLYLLNHQGHYFNRVRAKWRGQVEPVPWAP